jgi:hypothetical protein
MTKGQDCNGTAARLLRAACIPGRPGCTLSQPPGAAGTAGSIDADALRGTRLQFDIGGSGSIKVKGIEAETVAVSVGGSGDLKAGSGAARRLSVSIGGSGDVDLGQLRSDRVSVSGTTCPCPGRALHRADARLRLVYLDPCYRLNARRGARQELELERCSRSA